MGTSLEHVVERPVTGLTDPGVLRGAWARAVDHVQVVVCGLHGHDPMLQFDGGRMFLRCASCGYQSPGWVTGEHQPRLRFSGDASRHELRRPGKTGLRSVS